MIVQRYIHGEILLRLIWITGLLLLILASNRFVEYLADAAAGKIGSDIIFNMLWLKLLAMQPELLPLTLFIAVILVFSRMSRDNELVIFSVSGMGKLYQLKVVARFAGVFCILIAFISLFAAPWAESRITELQIKARHESDITGITAGRFKEFSEGDRIVYVEKISDDKTAMENVFLQIKQNEKQGVLTSSQARFDIDKDTGNRFIVFENGRRYVGQPGMLDYRITEYDKYGILIDSHSPESVVADLDALPTYLLLLSDLPAHKAELQWRISSVLASVILALFAVLLNHIYIRDNRYTLIFISILVYFLYSNLLGISKTLLKRDDLSPYLGLWWVHLILIAVMLLLYFSPEIARWRKGSSDIQVISAK